MLKVLKLKKSTYYYTLKTLEFDKNSELMQLILEIFTENKARYGYRRITLELKNRDKLVNHKKVKRLMKKWVYTELHQK